MSSALVLLGLAPTVLGQMGPTLNQKAQLCVQSPILGLLCVLGAPSIAFGMPWARTTPITHTDGNAFASGEMWFFSWISWAVNCIFSGRMQTPAQQTEPRTQSIWIILPKYSLAVGAAVNVFLNAWTLSRQTIVSWKCTSSYLEFLWVSLTLVPFCLAVVATSVERSEGTRTGSKGRPLWSSVFYSLSNIASAVHVLFGTVLFSSVLFIGTLDALGVVGQLTASTLVCQFITALELERGGYRAKIKGRGEFGRGIQLEQVKKERDREQRRHYRGGNAVLELLRARALDPERTARWCGSK